MVGRNERHIWIQIFLSFLYIILYYQNSNIIRCSLVGQDTRLSPERPGFESRQRNIYFYFLIVGLFSPWAYFEAYITFPSLGKKIQRKGFSGWAVFLGLTLRPVYYFHLGFLLGITLRPMYHFQTNYNPRVVLLFHVY